MLDLTSRDVWAPTRELAFGRYPLVLYAVRIGGTLERRTYCRCKAGTDRKYDDEKQVQRGDTLSSGLATPAPEVTGHPGVTESSAEQTRFCVKCREGDKGVKPLKTAQHDRVVQRTSVRACLCPSSVAGTSRLCSERGSCRRASAISLQLHGPSRPTSNQPSSHRAEWSRTERSRKQEPARRCRDRVVQTERPGRQASALTSSGKVAMYRNSLVFLPGVLQQLVVWLWRWSGTLVGVILRAWSGSTELCHVRC